MIYKISKSTFLSSIIVCAFFLSDAGAAGCCAPLVAKTTADANVLLVTLKKYNQELEQSIVWSASLVKTSMATTIEKERQLSALVLMRNNLALRADIQAATVRETLVGTEAANYNLQHGYNKDIQSELENRRDQ